MYNVIVKFNIIMCLMYPIIPDKVEELSQYIGWKDKLNFCSDIALIFENFEKVKAFNQI